MAAIPQGIQNPAYRPAGLLPAWITQDALDLGQETLMYRHVTEPPPARERTKFGKLLAALERIASSIGQVFRAFEGRL